MSGHSGVWLGFSCSFMTCCAVTPNAAAGSPPAWHLRWTSKHISLDISQKQVFPKELPLLQVSSEPWTWLLSLPCIKSLDVLEVFLRNFYPGRLVKSKIPGKTQNVAAYDGWHPGLHITLVLPVSLAEQLWEETMGATPGQASIGQQDHYLLHQTCPT